MLDETLGDPEPSPPSDRTQRRPSTTGRQAALPGEGQSLPGSLVGEGRFKVRDTWVGWETFPRPFGINISLSLHIHIQLFNLWWPYQPWNLWVSTTWDTVESENNKLEFSSHLKLSEKSIIFERMDLVNPWYLCTVEKKKVFNTRYLLLNFWMCSLFFSFF